MHLDTIAHAFRSASGQDCHIVHRSIEKVHIAGVEVATYWAKLDCQFDIFKVFPYVSVAMRERMSFQKQDETALKLQVLPGPNREGKIHQVCAVDLTVTRPIVNIVPLLIGLAMAFCLNMATSFWALHHDDALSAAFHIVREILGHDTTANPLQKNRVLDEVEKVALKKFVCSDGGSAHVGFVQGLGDTAVDQIHGGRRVCRCQQVARQGPRFVVEELPEELSSSGSFLHSENESVNK
eukprot:gb/GEZJ01001640.1/.p2 GENE.gb/GEZJ01001640.1/~~gb/GEZJ01001640.1/.p2  ORF type:complete len:238 (-),score=25.64 gb/GEZJ01001640.1/:5439-6152(-)